MIQPKYLPWHVEAGCRPDWECESDQGMVCVSFFDGATKAGLLIKRGDISAAVRISDPAAVEQLHRLVFP